MMLWMLLMVLFMVILNTRCWWRFLMTIVDSRCWWRYSESFVLFSKVVAWLLRWLHALPSIQSNAYIIHCTAYIAYSAIHANICKYKYKYNADTNTSINSYTNTNTYTCKWLLCPASNPMHILFTALHILHRVQYMPIQIHVHIQMKIQIQIYHSQHSIYCTVNRCKYTNTYKCVCINTNTNISFAVFHIA